MRKWEDTVKIAKLYYSLPQGYMECFIPSTDGSMASWKREPNTLLFAWHIIDTPYVFREWMIELL